jgi:hypothetical protein
VNSREEIAAAFGFEVSELGKPSTDQQTREGLYREWVAEAGPKIVEELSELLPEGLEFVWEANYVMDLTGLTCQSRTNAWARKE